ncbi:Rz1-like lysis system protein LysC [Pantoea anthophila]|uniref:Rz1-like lysis system protein LysC n=1 Tax=Pantoea anthophila TaxID=470931 RepID=UPI003CC73EDE
MPLNLFLVTLLTSCARTETQYVPVPPVPIPASLLADCEVPPIPEPLTWGESLELNERLLSVVEQCNRDKAAIRQIERERQK